MVGRLSLRLFRRALEDRTAWYNRGVVVPMDFVVSKEELHSRDWRAEIGSRSSSARDVRLLFDGEPDLEDYLLLRRFGREAGAGVMSTDDHVLERARRLRLATSDVVVLDTEPLDAQGVEAWVRKVRSR